MEFTYYELFILLTQIINAKLHKDKKYLVADKSKFEAIKELDFSIKTKQEFAENKFIAESHSPARMIMFLINFLGEMFAENLELTIYEDDPFTGKTVHDNIYKIIVKDRDTHIILKPTNPTASDKPYDFDLQFIRQITRYNDGNMVDTTAHAYDSFKHSYCKPERTMDFKSWKWTTGTATHGVNYIFSINDQGEIIIKDAKTLQIKNFKLSGQYDISKQKYLMDYLWLIKCFDEMQYCTWDEILN